MTQTLKIDINNNIATVTLNRPDKKNAMSLEMMDELTQAGQTLAKNADLRAVILTGAGDCFCSGIDLASLMSLAGNLDSVRQEILNPTSGHANRFQTPACVWGTLNVPVIAALTGVTFGAGAQLALGADFRIAAPDARLSIMESKWGLIPDMGITQSLPKLMRADQAMDLIMTGRILDASQAQSMGLITEIADDPLARAHEMAQMFVTKSPDALAAAKKLVNGTWGAGEQALRLEAKLQAEIIGQKNQMEMVAATMQKRDPKF